MRHWVWALLEEPANLKVLQERKLVFPKKAVLVIQQLRVYIAATDPLLTGIGAHRQQNRAREIVFCGFISH